MSDDLRDGLIAFGIVILVIAGIAGFKRSSFNIENRIDTPAIKNRQAEEYVHHNVNTDQDVKMYGKAIFNKSKNRLTFVSSEHHITKPFKRLGKLELEDIKANTDDKNIKYSFEAK